MFVIIAATLCSTSDMLGGSWDLVSKVISTLIGVISTVTLIITLVTKSHDPLSAVFVVFITVKKKPWPWSSHRGGQEFSIRQMQN